MATTITKTATSKNGNKVTVTVTCGWDSVTTHERVDGFEFDRTKSELTYNVTATFEIKGHRIENAGIQDFNDTKKAYVTKELKKRNQLPEGREVAGEVWSKTDSRKRLVLMSDTYADVIEAYNTALNAAKAEAEQDPGLPRVSRSVQKESGLCRVLREREQQGYQGNGAWRGYGLTNGGSQHYE